MTSFDLRIAIVGSGTIGLSFAALHLSHPTKRIQVVIHDPRPDIEDYVKTTLPEYVGADVSLPQLLESKQLIISSTLSTALESVDIVQEQGPENVSFKQKLWPQIEKAAPSTALFWSSTSGIPSSVQGVNMQEPARLLVVHPFNPPHIMPVLEIVPPRNISTDKDASKDYIDKTIGYWKTLNRSPVVLHEEVTGFVANRLSFALFREAIHLVNSGVVTAAEVDRIVEESMGPRWAVRGPFWSYHAGGGKEQGIRGLLKKVGGTVQACWDDAGTPSLRPEGEGSVAAWEDALCQQVEQSYGVLDDEDLRDRDEKTRKVLAITRA
ncbi:3-hydroxyacyl-CoA dehyrogenase, putative [Talaromyces stipitatus ATCC 10500]|uniref:3-hydroxyacyl-CoA dehyrogenase, putative n=1 Tax=Talaromyces stipitatus (strain ATCC 10500 / CBS 375.48 / QM 6759 / NRRL 1006) TaxID=441959 RepID=B8M9F7_TALSN|nr:3-hydroxyacyl-CoA dehyrogenase, putative [Talaromyces stipitatus ATCC 10500]EED17717.1 3-hydroxyacyl-CoA dehyrogenase, putative [Talaromyces stipitatus ATCC 10500]